MLFRIVISCKKVFTELGYDVQVIEGEFDGAEHYWNIINGLLCDLSSDQFGEPFGIIEDTANYYKIDEYNLKDQLEEFDNEEDEDIYMEI